MKPVLLYSHEEDPITAVILSSEVCLELDIISLSLKSLLKDVAILDEIYEKQVKIQWILPSGITISNSKECYLFNRALTIPHKIFEDFAEEDQNYSICEFRAYLAFAIEAFPNCSAKPGAFGLSGNQYSLPRQWELVQNSKLNLSVPDYWLGNLNDISDNENLVYSHPYNYYYWKPNKIELKKTTFAFERPKGIPIISSIVGNEIRIFPFRNADVITSESLKTIKELSYEILNIFNYRIAEILFFSIDNLIIFGMISNMPYASRNKDWFTSSIYNFLRTEISSERCEY